MDDIVTMYLFNMLCVIRGNLPLIIDRCLHFSLLENIDENTQIEDEGQDKQDDDCTVIFPEIVVHG